MNSMKLAGYELNIQKSVAFLYTDSKLFKKQIYKNNLICNSIKKDKRLHSVQFSSVTQLCLTLCDLMDCSIPSFPVHHQLPELAQTHVH